MYKGYEIKADDELWDDVKRYYSIGKSLFDKAQRVISSELSHYTSRDGIINGSEIQEEWFPTVDANIFISHSHGDEEKAIALAGWLNDKFGLNAFVDSCVWGNSNELLRTIDNIYCFQPESNTYNYASRNHSTAHVHMILMAALNKMIHKAECLFFLDTNNSVALKGITDKTLSPWIYGEIEISRTIEKIEPKRIRKNREQYPLKKIVADSNESRKLPLAHELQKGHLLTLSTSTLRQWANNLTEKGEVTLNYLYGLTEPQQIRG